MRRTTLLFLAGVLLCVVPASVWAAEAGAEGGWGWYETLGRWLNLALLFGVIAYFVRKPLAEFFASRRAEIQQEIAKAREAKETAEQRLAEIEQRLANLDDEIAALRRQAQEDAEKERERILNQAEAEARKVLSAASREIDGLSRAAHQELKAYAAELSVQLAEDKIRKGLDAGARKRIVDRFFITLGDDDRRRS